MESRLLKRRGLPSGESEVKCVVISESTNNRVERVERNIVRREFQHSSTIGTISTPIFDKVLPVERYLRYIYDCAINCERDSIDQDCHD